MRVQVLDVVKTDKGFNVATVRQGSMVGTCLTAPDVVEPGEYEMKGTVQVRQGRFVSLLRVEKLAA